MNNKKIKYIIIFFVFLLSAVYAQSESFNENFGSPSSQSSGKPGDGNKALIQAYDPYMDNHLVAPQGKRPSGLFGHHISDVERCLKKVGAKNGSYAFGKYSRMILSKYEIILYFDKNKYLGEVEIIPTKPYNFIPPSAKDFFIKLFLAEDNLSEYSLELSSASLKIKYGIDEGY